MHGVATLIACPREQARLAFDLIDISTLSNQCLRHGWSVVLPESKDSGRSIRFLKLIYADALIVVVMLLIAVVMLLMLFVLLIFPIFVVMVSVAIVLVAIIVPARIRVAAVIGSASAVIRPINVVGAVTVVWPAVVGAVTVVSPAVVGAVTVISWPIVVVFLRCPAPCHVIAGKRRKRSNASCHQHRDGTDQENLPHAKISHIIRTSDGSNFRRFLPRISETALRIPRAGSPRGFGLTQSAQAPFVREARRQARARSRGAGTTPARATERESRRARRAW